jgi:hypothetical protein
MGRFLLEFEDQRRSLRTKRDFVASVVFIVRTAFMIIVLGYVATVLWHLAWGEEMSAITLVRMIRESIGRGVGWVFFHQQG